jgi:putative nucleotidyltransferase with HDIG domain
MKNNNAGVKQVYDENSNVISLEGRKHAREKLKLLLIKDSATFMRRLADVNKELWIILTLLALCLAANYAVDSASALLGLYTLPTILSAYIYGRRHAVFTALLSFILVFLISYSKFTVLEDAQIVRASLCDVVAWGCALIITAYAMGTLFVRNAAKLMELRQSYIGVLHILHYFIAKDKYTENHSYRVSIYAMKIAAEMDFSPSRIEDIRAAALLHDIGKLDIGREILYKASKLTLQEYEQIKDHVKKGVDMLDPLKGPLERIIPIILAHHERYNGSGYDHSRGSQIPIEARIIAVADVYDSLISDRPYRRGIPPRDAREHIVKGSGSEFDPKVVGAFLNIFMRGQMDIPVIHIH